MQDVGMPTLALGSSDARGNLPTGELHSGWPEQNDAAGQVGCAIVRGTNATPIRGTKKQRQTWRSKDFSGGCATRSCHR